jgi:adenine-specific DNA-methyltransferase
MGEKTIRLMGKACDCSILPGPDTDAAEMAAGSEQVFDIGNRRFVGSKQKLADWIVKTINANCEGDSFFEVFAGTSIVSSQMAAQMKRIVLNDTLQSNCVIYEAFYGKGRISQGKLDAYKGLFNNINANGISNGWFTKNYGGKYFGIKDCAVMESIRNILADEKQKMTNKEYIPNRSGFVRLVDC